MYYPSMIYTLIFALFAGTHLVSGNPVPQDVAAAVGGIIGIAGAAAAPAAGDPNSCVILESKCKSNHGNYAEYCVEYCNQCDASDKVDCDAGIAGPVDCVGAGGTKCYR